MSAGALLPLIAFVILAAVAFTLYFLLIRKITSNAEAIQITLDRTVPQPDARYLESTANRNSELELLLDVSQRAERITAPVGRRGAALPKDLKLRIIVGHILQQREIFEQRVKHSLF